ncbi:MAG: hypothetical protein ACYSUM_03510 [Planctomycetota bacterium]|jgi:hypothetical protein
MTMTATGRWLIAVVLTAGVASAQGAPNQRRPYIGYLCAAGGQKGTVVRITAGGQNLRGAKRVIVSGEGVSGTVIRHRRTPWLLKPEQRREVAQMLRRLANRKATGRDRKRQRKEPPAVKPGQPGAAMEKPVPLPDHPMLKNLESLTPKELRRVAYEFLDPGRRSQLSAQIAEAVEIEVRIAADALPGERELRIGTPRGLTNPVPFHVGLLPEFFEQEPNDYPTSPQPTVDLPRVLNGQVSFKDIDRFRFRARRGAKLVIEAHARRLVPYLADAVPGWFQATLALYDEKGDEVSFVDDYRFDPDPVLFFEVPDHGEYVLEIRDAIYRGREDFVYRITVAERPFITTVFPLGGQAGSMTIAEVGGWNLPWDYVVLDTWPGPDPIRESTWNSAGPRTNTIHYAVGDLPECIESEPDDAPRQRIDLPMIVNGRISSAGEVDGFRFSGGVGKEIVAEVQARRLGSPLDSLLQLTDDEGRVLAWNDDHEDRAAGLVTHQADSYVRKKLPATGTYHVRVADAQGHGGQAYAYRLRVSPPRPDFAVIVTPASVNVRGGSLVPVTVHAVRKDGFDGEIELFLEDAPEGFLLSGEEIPAGRDRIRMTLAAPPKRPGRPIRLKIVGRARIAGKRVMRRAIPAEDMMQAFGLRHLVPARQLLVDITRGGRRGSTMRLASDRRARIPVGGTTEVRIDIPSMPALAKVEFKLSDPPAGVSLRKVRAKGQRLVLVVAAERDKAQVGLADNLIVEAYAQVAVGRRGGKAKAKDKAKAKGKAKAAQQTRRYFAGVLPAVPFVIVKR